MKRAIAALFVIAALGAAVWFGILHRGEPAAAAGAAEQLAEYDFEAQTVVLRQMDAEGRLQYEIEAERIVQLPDAGGIHATRPVFHHDPPGAAPGGAHRWTLTAEQGTFPANGSTVSLSGQVRATGIPSDSGTRLQLTATDLQYDMGAEQASSAGEVEITAGRNFIRGRGMRVNIATGRVQVESSTHAAKISL